MPNPDPELIDWRDVELYPADEVLSYATSVRQALAHPPHPDIALSLATALQQYRTTGTIWDYFLANPDGTATPEPWNDGPKIPEIDWTGLTEYLDARSEPPELDPL